MTGALALFVKTPGLSPVKTRLAAGIGAERAGELFLACADAVSELLQQFERRSGVRCHWAIAEDDSLAPAFWAARGGLHWLAQGEGGLGARMARVQRQLVRESGFGLLIGADAPQLRIEHLEEAAAWLRSPQPRQVLGPAADGGFWLYGGNRIAPDALWESVNYSEPRTARDFHAALSAYGSWRELPMLADLDTAEDLQVLAEALRALPQALPAQQRLLAAIERRLAEPRHA
jgi:rSAM/selenodomain-associated transferase 1